MTAPRLSTPEVILLACQLHAKQRRRYTDDAYIVHPAEVASILHRHGFHGPSVVQVAWLHDTIEDTDATAESLLEAGVLPATVRLVVALTDPPAVKGGPNRAARKAAARERIAKFGVMAQLVKLADLISNARSLKAHDPDFFVTFSKEARLFVESLGTERAFFEGLVSELLEIIDVDKPAEP